MNKTVYMMGILLSITPILHMHNGVPASDPCVEPQTRISANAIVLEKMPKIKIAALMHTHAFPDSTTILGRGKDNMPFGPKLSVEINPSSVHTSALGQLVWFA
jgi:hypothetical protein